MFVMWLGEQITERGIGNGITMIIVAGIVAGLPRAIGSTLDMVRSGEMNPIIVLLIIVVVLLVTLFCVFVETRAAQDPGQLRQAPGRPAHDAGPEHAICLSSSTWPA